MSKLSTIIAAVIAASLSCMAAAEPPKQKPQPEAKQEKIEIAVEKIERAGKRQQQNPTDDADGDGYGDATKRAGDPIPGIDITVNQGTTPKPPPPPPANGTIPPPTKAKATQPEKCKDC
ncbi:hypothetical protein [Pseudidiomarina mangrovi]|uniref:hypothetical protein n=1 Tax=Pseudidiomarina mangrovi TaxID=2487133 RepID=UPI000FCA9B0D|nr:hypothetical protein [Pseudidiomarina mangrovi]